VARAVVPFSPVARAVSASYGSVEYVGRSLFRDFFYPFEVISLILLVAMAGAVALAKKKL
jgi:NADH-quinone oxidoreductase subunit J